MKNLETMVNSLFPFTAIKDCMKSLNKDDTASAYETSCGFLMLENEETVQVKIIITRIEDDFLDPFEIVKHSNI